METALVFATGIIIVLTILLIISLNRICALKRQLKKHNDAEMWHRLAITDNLTGINNRNAYTMRLDTLKGKPGGNSAIVLFDIDDFKKINDTKGHPAGDLVLQKVAKMLINVFEAPMFEVYRIGGDEFAVIGEGTCEDEIINRLILLRDNFERGGDIRLSKGYAIIERNVASAVSDADKMLYSDKMSKKKKQMPL